MNDDSISNFQVVRNEVVEDAEPIEMVEAWRDVNRFGDWQTNQFAAWGMFGTAAIINAMYWLQQYYYKFWMKPAKKYASGADYKYATIVTVNIYSIWGLAEWWNVLILILQWVPTAFVWILTIFDVSEIHWFFIRWCGWMHYVDALRFLTVAIIKIVSFFNDFPTQVDGYSGLNKNYHISKGHTLQYWDLLVEWLGFMTSFGFYLDLKSLINHHEEEGHKAHGEEEVHEEEEAAEEEGALHIEF